VWLGADLKFRGYLETLYSYVGVAAIFLSFLWVMNASEE